MPDTHVASETAAGAAGAPAAVSFSRRRSVIRWSSPLLRRILLVNLLPLALLLAALLYLDNYQNGLLEAEVSTLREQAKIYAGALGEAAVRTDQAGNPRLVPDIAQALLDRLTEPTPNAEAKVYAPDGQVIADSRVRRDSGGEVREEPLPPAPERGQLVGAIARMYDHVLSWFPHKDTATVLNSGPTAAGPEWQPDVKEEVRLTGSDQSREMPPYIRRTQDNQLLVTVAEPVQRAKHTVGIVLLTREAREVDQSLLDIRLSILGLFGFALALTVLLSWYLSLTIARPILRLAQAAEEMQEGRGRAGAVPRSLLARNDEVGELAAALSGSARALWDRMDAIERFAADVAHEIKNPLSSIRSAIETLRRVDDADKQRRLLGIVTEDVVRLDRLISDISDASRIDAELSRVATVPIEVGPILATLADMYDATRSEDDPRIDLSLPDPQLTGPIRVQAVEGRLVQVLRNLINNAQSFSPPRGRIGVTATPADGMVDICVEDDGPGIPEGKLEHVFDRFYSERPRGERFGQHSGLGLSISRQIAEALKGQLIAENRRDGGGHVLGARFVLSLPAA
jgi:two-component system sensor histidine kinase ChvG